MFFRDQTLTPDEEIAFATRFGAIHLHPFVRGLDEHPESLEMGRYAGIPRGLAHRPDVSIGCHNPGRKIGHFLRVLGV